MRAPIIIGVMTALAAASTLAAQQQREQEVRLRDGTTVVIFEDGKMTMRDRKGLPVSMAESQIMETEDGRTIAMKGNEMTRKTAGERELDRIYFGGG